MSILPTVRRHQSSALAIVIAAVVGIGGTLLGAYVGIYLMMFKGIVMLIAGIQGHVGAAIAWGIIRILFASAVTWVIIFASWFTASLIGMLSSD